MLRRTPLKRGQPLARTGGLKRGTKLKAKRSKPRRSSRVRDPKHLAWVRTLDCCHCARRSPSEAHHDTKERGMGQKADDTRTIPLCRSCHDGAQHYLGAFKFWDRDRMRAWFEAELAKVMALKEALRGATVKQEIRIKLDFTISHETDEPGCTPALDHFAYAITLTEQLISAGVIKGPAVVKNARRTISTNQESAA